ncbi:MAG: serine hydrolase domain-containing protein, partial [Candidatus Heimdallarchaeota archaeon]
NLYHLMTMTSGLDCDDNNDNSTGTEDKMQSQKIERDWYKFTLDLPMVANPGEIGAYGTAAVNLLGGVLLQATNLTTYEFADKYLFKPLGITEYYFNLTPEDNGYLGGGIRLRPRDMGKIGLLYLSGGLWNSKRIISEQWITKSIVKHTEVGGNFYGYNWWHFQCEHNQIKYDSYYAGGNGGQYIIVTPKLNLVTVLTGGNYNRWPVWSKFIQFLPNYIIPSVS